MINKLGLESGHVLKYRRHFGDHGIVAYDVQHQRHKLIKLVDDIDEIINLKNKGWRVCGSKHEWIMQAPEAVLCDLNEPASNMATQDLVEIYALHKYITSYIGCCDMDYLIEEVIKKENLGDLEVGNIPGCASLIEKRVFGTDARVKEFPKLFFKHVKESPEWMKFYKEAQEELNIRELNFFKKNITDTNSNTQEKYNFVLNKYKALYGENSYELSELPKEAIYGFWNQLPNKFDVHVFVLKSALRYYYGYLEEIGDINAKLWEYHVSSNLKRLMVVDKDLKNKKTLLVDRSYSGHTIDEMSYLLKKEGADISVLAMFPKSLPAIKSSDYFLFLDKIIAKEWVMTQQKNWEVELFKKIVNNNLY